MTAEHDGKVTVFPWSGTDPDSDTMCFSYVEADKSWTFDDASAYDNNKPKRQGAEHIGMYRMPGFKASSKIQENCTKFIGIAPFNGINPKDDVPNMTLTNFKTFNRQHMIVKGMYDVFVIVTADGKRFDLFNNHSLFLQEDIEAHVVSLRATGCPWVIENLMYSGIYLRNAIDTVLYQKVIEDCGVTASGPETLCTLMKILYSDSFEAIEQCRLALKAIKLADFPGENVDLCSTKIEFLAERLDCAGAFDMDQLLVIAKIMEGAADERFRAWATTQFRSFNDIAKKLRVYHVTTLKSPIPRFDTFLKECRTEYREMIAQKRWTPQVNATDNPSSEPTLPSAYHGQVESQVQAMMATIKQLGITSNADQIRALVTTQLKQLASGSPPSGGNNPARKCFRCGSNDHVISACPVVVSTDTRTSWKTTPPAPGTEATATMERGGRKYVWCSKCNRWMFHRSETHDAWAARTAARAADGSNNTPIAPIAAPITAPAVAVASLAQIESNDDWMGPSGLPGFQF